VFEKIELMIDESSVKLADAVGMTEKIRARVREIVAGTIRHVVRNLNLFHLGPIHRVRTEIARDR
jgi:hypothetical protein